MLGTLVAHVPYSVLATNAFAYTWLVLSAYTCLVVANVALNTMPNRQSR
jgi:hypothetical protein